MIQNSGTLSSSTPTWNGASAGLWSSRNAARCAQSVERARRRSTNRPRSAGPTRSSPARARTISAIVFIGSVCGLTRRRCQRGRRRHQLPPPPPPPPPPEKPPPKPLPPDDDGMARVHRAGRGRCRSCRSSVASTQRVERVAPGVPRRRLELLGVDAFERLRPLLRAAEHDRVRQVLREDVVLLGEAARACPPRLRRTAGGSRAPATTSRCPCRCAPACAPAAASSDHADAR